ncbi:MAG: YARHG domain-containing protein [Luteolibacter sp.]|uniref:YARHG domain-containing protein n=1 Tax=Luteolibacter sp. TaxID=1962973 RepID=UPI0032676D38
MKLTLHLLAAMALVSAGILHLQAAEEKPDSGQEDVNTPDTDAKVMLGTYVGAFGERKITIGLDRVIGNTVTGYSIVAGNERAFSGSWTKVEHGYSVIAKEPGDHPADGVFTFVYMAKTKSLLGVWQANDKQIGARNFDLPQRKFKYDPKAGQYPEASARLLKEEDVENMKSEPLRFMRNEIYARHGYSFKLADMREHFDKLDWYMPVAVDIASKLTKIEKENAALIKRYEKYSAEHYDDFGR